MRPDPPTDRQQDLVAIDAEQLAELQRDQHLLKFFLEKTSDHVYFKDLECRFIRTSAANARRFGLATADDAIGKSDFDFFDEDAARVFFEDELRIIESGQGIVDFEEREVWEDGAEAWASTSKMPILDRRAT